MARTAATITPTEVSFLTERHLDTLATIRPDATRHAVAIAFTSDAAAVEAHQIRYRPTRPNPERVAIEIQVERIIERS